MYHPGIQPARVRVCAYYTCTYSIYKAEPPPPLQASRWIRCALDLHTNLLYASCLMTPTPDDDAAATRYIHVLYIQYFVHVL